MKRSSDIDRVLEIWMVDGPAAIPDRVVDVVAARIGLQRQRRPWPLLGRTNVTTPIKLIAALAAALVVAVVGYNLLPGIKGSGGPSPSPTAATPLAVGEFTSHGVAATIDAKGAGADVTGTMTMSDSGDNATVDLECSRSTESNLLIIGGLVTNSTFTEFFPQGHRVAIGFRRGDPVEGVWYVVFEGDAPLESCPAVIDALLNEPGGLDDALEPIEGTVTFGT